MKKFLPAILLSILFLGITVSQMVIHGQQLSASKLSASAERFSLYETQFKNFKDSTTHGSKVNLGEVKKPIVIISFWASWCTPCLAEFDSINKFLAKYKDEVYLVGVNNDTEEVRKAIKKVEKKYSLAFESIDDPQGGYAQKFKIKEIPHSIIFHNGKVIKEIAEEFDYMDAKFHEFLDQTLRKAH